jgi:tryptophan halogenase
MSAPDLLGLVRELRAPFGLERSCKIVAGALHEDRFLISLHRTALGERAAERLGQMARALGVPAAFEHPIAAALGDADIVHFGYEGGEARAVCKIYLEYASQVRRAQALDALDPVLVYLAYKWTWRLPEQRTVTRYTWLPCRTDAAIAERLRALVPVTEAPRALACGLDLLSRAGRRTETGKLFLMEVAEPDNRRRSYDLNVYRADLHLGDIADLLERAAAELAVPQPAIRALVKRCGALDLGHLSGGMGRDGREFVTVYYGVEAH